ncbi:flagellar export chaperone FliS [Clostridium drakei]|uniref:Flagellar secretion chaperone FliS n=1 Tax=Clostridium drakei TaxID=332101 RepID=A0A2U8DLP4_9CLOT|nr:flagellar export chaperone FliS [Clostridium drakei]AWI03670.1 flagellar protein FliS [Clostridium drakei]
MYGANAYNTYKNNSVNFSSKEQMLLMLVEASVKFAKIGRQAILDKNISKSHENIVKCQNIFYELMVTLDVDAGGEWAKNLMRVYDFITRRLTDANIKKDAAIMDEILPVIEQIKDMWEEAYKVSKKSK